MVPPDVGVHGELLLSMDASPQGIRSHGRGSSQVISLSRFVLSGFQLTLSVNP